MRLQGLNESGENKRQTDWAETERHGLGRDGQRDTDMSETYRYIQCRAQAGRETQPSRDREKDTHKKTDRETQTL